MLPKMKTYLDTIKSQSKSSYYWIMYNKGGEDIFSFAFVIEKPKDFFPKYVVPSIVSVLLIKQITRVESRFFCFLRVWNF